MIAAFEHHRSYDCTGYPETGIKKPPKTVRKTAASKLEEHPEYSRYEGSFLGHAPATMAERHYIKPSDAQFDKALTWLREQFLG